MNFFLNGKLIIFYAISWKLPNFMMNCFGGFQRKLCRAFVWGSCLLLCHSNNYHKLNYIELNNFVGWEMLNKTKRTIILRIIYRPNVTHSHSFESLFEESSFYKSFWRLFTISVWSSEKLLKQIWWKPLKLTNWKVLKFLK